MSWILEVIHDYSFHTLISSPVDFIFKTCPEAEHFSPSVLQPCWFWSILQRLDIILIHWWCIPLSYDLHYFCWEVSYNLFFIDPYLIMHSYLPKPSFLHVQKAKTYKESTQELHNPTIFNIIKKLLSLFPVLSIGKKI